MQTYAGKKRGVVFIVGRPQNAEQHSDRSNSDGAGTPAEAVTLSPVRHPPALTIPLSRQRLAQGHVHEWGPQLPQAEC